MFPMLPTTPQPVPIVCPRRSARVRRSVAFLSAILDKGTYSGQAKADTDIDGTEYCFERSALAFSILVDGSRVAASKMRRWRPGELPFDIEPQENARLNQ